MTRYARDNSKPLTFGSVGRRDPRSAGFRFRAWMRASRSARPERSLETKKSSSGELHARIATGPRLPRCGRRRYGQLRDANLMRAPRGADGSAAREGHAMRAKPNRRGRCQKAVARLPGCLLLVPCPWIRVWIGSPPPTLDRHGAGRPSRSLTPPQHHGGQTQLWRGQRASRPRGVDGGSGVDSSGWRRSNVTGRVAGGVGHEGKGLGHDGGNRFSGSGRCGPED